MTAELRQKVHDLPAGERDRLLRRSAALIARQSKYLGVAVPPEVTKVLNVDGTHESRRQGLGQARAAL